MACDGGDRDRGRNADKDQQRRHQKTAADPEHAGDETNRSSHRQDEEDIDRNVGDRKVKLHARLLFVVLPLTSSRPPTAWLYLCRQQHPAGRAIRVRGAGYRGLCITEFDGRMDQRMRRRAIFCPPDEVRNARCQGFPNGSVMRCIASASLGASQRTSLVADIASTMEDETPILVM